MKKYQWLEMWDGGQESKLFNTLEEAKKDMRYHASEVRWTASELKEYTKRWENFINIYKLDVEYDEDGDYEILSEEETKYSITLNKRTLSRIY